jgi:Ca2+-binding RTX toxin-like protein
MRIVRAERAILIGGALGALALTAVAAPAASAATAKLSGSSLIYEAGAGETNDLVISAAAKDGLTVSDSGAPITALAGCSAQGEHKVTCRGNGISLVIVKTFDGDDTLVNHGQVHSRLDGGEGNDRVVGGSKADVIYGGDGEDDIAGRGGNDRIRTAGFWADTIGCGAGRDTVFADSLDSVGPRCESVTRESTG